MFKHFHVVVLIVAVILLVVMGITIGSAQLPSQPFYGTYTAIPLIGTCPAAGVAGTVTVCGDSALGVAKMSILGGAYGPLAPVATYSCGTTATCSNTLQVLPHEVYGSVALTSASPSTATVTLAAPAAFTGGTSYFCNATNTTTAANGVKVVNTNGTTFVITGPNTVTDVIDYRCVGT